MSASLLVLQDHDHAIDELHRRLHALPERAAAAGALDAALLATYERLRSRLDGVAVSRVQAGVCSGCHLALSAADLDKFNRLAPGQTATCEECSRLLIRE